MSASRLLADLKAAGLNVVEEPGWRTRGKNWRVGGKPEGVMQHHTAPPNPYPIKALYRGGKIKCNMATHEDGTLYLVAYNACNYSSGPGSKKVLTGNVRPSIPPPDNARARGLIDTPLWGGNKHYWNYENSHPGDGSPIPQIQLDTIITSNGVVNNHFGLNWEQTISHAEHSRRKIDPRWSGDNRTAIEQIREGLQNMPLSETDIAEIRAVIVDVLGGDRILMPKIVPTEPDRYGNQGSVNSIWHATGKGEKLFNRLVNVPQDTADEIADRLEE